MTDPMRANSFGQPVGGKPFPAAVAPILAGLKKRAFQDDGIARPIKPEWMPTRWFGGPPASTRRGS